MQPIPLVLTVLLMSKTEPETGGNRRKPLCVDLDGTLIHTDCLFETLVGAIRTSPLTLLRVPGWFLQGRPTLKSELAKRFLPDPKLLPWNKEVLEYVKRKKKWAQDSSGDCERPKSRRTDLRAHSNIRSSGSIRREDKPQKPPKGRILSKAIWQRSF